MFHEILNGDTLGIRTSGNPIVVLTDGNRIVGKVQPAPACYATPTASGDEVAELWPEVNVMRPEPAHRFQFSVPVYSLNMGDRTVEASAVWEDITVDAAHDRVKADINNRWRAALAGGIPLTITINGGDQKALLRYEEIDQLVWNTWDYSMPAPAGGLLVALAEPLIAPGKPYDGETEFAIAGTQRLQPAKVAINVHVNTASLAWETGMDDIAAIRDGAGTDAEKVAALAAYDVEALAWPTNELTP